MHQRIEAKHRRSLLLTNYQKRSEGSTAAATLVISALTSAWQP